MTPKDNQPTERTVREILQAARNWHGLRSDTKLSMSLEEAEAAIQRLMQARDAEIERKARLDVWRELRRRDGLYLNSDGCLEIHPDYIDERIGELEAQIKDNKE